MRRILGVLRHAADRAELEPQPGVAQIYALIQAAREDGQPIELNIEGDPGTLAAGVDIGLYRILEEALHSVSRSRAGVVGVELRFNDENLELRLTADRQGPNGWPTDVMRERVALCDGELHAEARDDGWHFVARMPRGLQGALA
jgi:signal transduction histidine kinase